MEANSEKQGQSGFHNHSRAVREDWKGSIRPFEFPNPAESLESTVAPTKDRVGVGVGGDVAASDG
jgi:hypothetical protein